MKSDAAREFKKNLEEETRLREIANQVRENRLVHKERKKRTHVLILLGAAVESALRKGEIDLELILNHSLDRDHQKIKEYVQL